MVDWLFRICVNFLNWLGKTTGLTYVEISVVFNLWVQGGLLVISALVPFIVALVRYGNHCHIYNRLACSCGDKRVFCLEVVEVA